MPSLPETLIAPALPFPYTFPPAHTALLLIDLQRDFLLPGGFGDIQSGSSLELANSCVEPCVRLLSLFRALHLPVLHTREGHKPDLSDCPAPKLTRGQHAKRIGDGGPMGRLLVRGELGHDFIDACAPRANETVIDKPGKGAFWSTALLETLRNQGITHLVVGGVTTECCVSTTVREANDRGLECCVVREATAGYNADFKNASLDMIWWADGLFGHVAELADIYRVLEPWIPAATPATWNGDLSFAALSAAYRARATTPTAVITALYPRLADSPEGTWIHLFPLSLLLALAAQLEAAHPDPANRPPLYGLPFSIKDSIDLAHTPTTVACPPLTTHPTVSAPSVKTLLALGAIPLGKTNLDCLATGLTGCRSVYGTPSSIFSPSHISGGSSSGAAVSVGARLCSFALATDTAGSGRVPAAFNGVVGWKPTKGTLSFEGVAKACESLDCLAILAPRVEEVREVWRLMLEHQPSPSADRMGKHYPPLLSSSTPIRPIGGKFRFAAPPALDLCPAYAAAFNTLLQRLPALGGTPAAGPWEAFKKASALLYGGTLVCERLAALPAELLASFHISDEDAADAADAEGVQGVHPVVHRIFRNVLARASTPVDVFRDLHTVASLRQEVRRALGGGGGTVLVVPTVPWHPTLSEVEKDPVKVNERLGVWTQAANVLDLAACAVPAGMIAGEGEGAAEGAEGAEGRMPFGVTILGLEGEDAHVLDVAARVEAEMRGVVHRYIPRGEWGTEGVGS
ncbi:amidase signature domain-containing protein [Geopyxis carbonaria]|nr:amidase signature domain-containing protein [Geopyxis carbonaria]